MSLTKYLPHENPSYDALFLKASKYDAYKYDLGSHSNRDSTPFFWGLRHHGGIAFQNNLIIYEAVLSSLAQTDPPLCKQILEDQVATVGLKTTARISAELGINLDIDQVYQKLPAWMKKLQALQASKDISKECVAARELGLGLYTTAGFFDGLLTELILRADSDYKRKYVKRYLGLHPLSAADAQALRVHHEYRPDMERAWTVSDQPPGRHCYLHNLLSMAMCGTLCVDRLSDNPVMGTSLDEANIIKMFLAEDVSHLNAKAVVQVFSGDDINVGSGLNILLETALRYHMRQCPIEQANRLSVTLAEGLAEVLSIHEAANLDSDIDATDGPKIEGMASVVRAVAQAGFQGATDGMKALSALAVSQQQLDHRKLLRVLKLGLFNECRSVETNGFRKRANDEFFARVQLQGAMLTTGSTPKGQPEEKLACPGINLEHLPQTMMQPLADIICELIATPFKNGQSMSAEELQTMIDLDVLLPQHMTRIARNEQALTNLLKARIPRHLIEASELAMATNLANDLGL